MEQDTESTRVRWPRWFPRVFVALSVVALAALALAWDSWHRNQQDREILGTEIRAMKQAAERDRELFHQRLGQSEETNAQLQGELSIVMKRLRLTQNELTRAHQEASQIREHDSQQLTEIERAVESELAAKASAEDLKTLGGDVNGVKTDLEATKHSLQLARGELGTLIARNHDEVEKLRHLGERDYYEFSIERKGRQQNVGGLEVELRSTNPKKSVFSLVLYVNDRRIEKRDHPVNEPIYFYAPGALAPSEIVVNNVEKNRIVGYLSAPKQSTKWAGR